MSDVLFPGRFRELVDYYAAGRPVYPPRLARRVASLIGLDTTRTVLDLGTGPGFLACDFRPFAGKVIGLDPEPAMLRIARQRAEAGALEIDFIDGSAADLGPQFAPLYLVTIGRAFHWMDRRQILNTLDTLIEPGGAVALFQESYPVVPANDWQPSFQAILDYYGAEDPARERTHRNKDHEAVLLESPFSDLERVSVLEPRLTSIEHFVDHALSFARTWQGRPGSRLKDMAVEVRDALTPYARSNMVAEIIEGTALIARRPHEVTEA